MGVLSEGRIDKFMSNLTVERIDRVCSKLEAIMGNETNTASRKEYAVNRIISII